MTALRSVLFITGSAASATLRYRVRQPEETLRAAGVRTAAVHVTDRRASSLADRADVVVLYRCPAGAELVALLTRLRSRAVPPLVTYDVDDLVFRGEHIEHLPFLSSLGSRQRASFERDVRLRERLVPLADMVTASTREVLAELALLTDAPAVLLPNGVGREQLRRADAVPPRRRAEESFRIGYLSGSATHDDDWRVVEPVVVDLLRERPEAELWLVGKVRPSAAIEAVREQVRQIRYVDWTDLAAIQADIDVNLAPLAPSPFTEAKSAIKWLEAALVATPTIASPTGPFRSAIVDGQTGFLASGPQEWRDRLVLLATDRDLRARVGAAARTAASAGYGPAAQTRWLLDAFERVPDRAHPARQLADGPELPSMWSTAPVRLERYPFAADLRGLELRPAATKVPQAVAIDVAARAHALSRRAGRAVRRRLPRR